MTVLLFICGACFVQILPAQNQALSLKEITTGLQATSGDFTFEERLNFLIDSVKVRGVDFLVTAENETALKDAGATSELVEIIRDESRRVTVSREDISKANDLYNLGLSFFSKEEYPQAIEHFQQALALNPRHSYAYGGLGLAYYSQNNFEKSIEFYSKAIAAKSDPNLYINRAAAYFAIKDFNKAVRDYTQAIEKSPSPAKIYLSRGLAHFSNDNYDKAIADYEKALELDPNYAAAKQKLTLTKKWLEVLEKRKQKENQQPD